MKYKLVAFSLLLFVVNIVIGQEEEYIETIAAEVCECGMEYLEEESQMTTTQIGLCMIQAATKFKEELLRDHQINMSIMDEQTGQQLGVLIGMQMFAICPDFVMTMGELGDENEEGPESFSGKIRKVKSDQFISFQITNSDNKTEQFIWLFEVESNQYLEEDYASMKGKDVEVLYSLIELFDPEIGEYWSFKVLNSMNIQD